MPYRRGDGGEPEAAARGHGARVSVQREGPLDVRGAVSMRDGEGRLVREGVRVALRRDGDSKIKPYCDNSHIDAGFRAP